MLAGLSAGAMCWFQGGVTRSSGPPEPLAGLGLLEGSLTVHADGEPERLPVWLAGVRDGTLPGGWALDDGVGLLFRGLRMERVVSSRPGAGAQRVDRSPASSCATASSPSCSATAERPRSAASTRPCRSCAACIACGAAPRRRQRLSRSSRSPRRDGSATAQPNVVPGAMPRLSTPTPSCGRVLVDRHGSDVELARAAR